MDDEAASFRTSTDCTSDGFREERMLIPCVPPPKLKFDPPVKLVVLFTGIPSTTYRGSELALMEVVPRTRMLKPPPGDPAFWDTCTPPALPCIAWGMLGRTSCSICSDLMLETELASVARSMVPYPAATTSTA